jgi:hypothetical protein
MARKPNYDFERRERERLKSEKNAARAEAKIKPITEDAPSADADEPKTEG